MMSESLDGGAVTYRSSRHFDVLNENIVFDLKHWDSNLPKATDAYAYRTLLENRQHGQGLVLLNNTSHDERNLSDPWEAVIFSKRSWDGRRNNNDISRTRETWLII